MGGIVFVCCQVAANVGVKPSLSNAARCWSSYRDNVPNDGPQSFFKLTIAIPVMNDLTNDLRDRMKDSKHAETFALLPSVIFKNGYL